MDKTVFPRGDEVHSENFLGTVFLSMMMSDSEHFDAQVYNVSFGPGARNSWHTHPGGQLLLVTAGTGCYQEKGKPLRILRAGDVVAIRPEVLHWHGAAPDSGFTHVGITTQVAKGPAVWYEPVNDEAYRAALLEVGYDRA